MLLSATLTLALGMCPQGQDPPAALLAQPEQKSLQGKLARLIDARLKYDGGSKDSAREKALKEYDKAKEAFQSEWDSRVEKKGNLLKSIVDLQAIFENCFTYERLSAVSLRKFEAKDGIPAYYLSVPKAYKADVPTRTVLVMPGMDDKGDWIDGKKWIEQTYTDKSALANDSIVHVPVVPKDVEFDPVPDYTRSDAAAAEARRNQELMLSLGETMRQYNVDRARLFLDASKGACGFALRAAAHFPDRIAGLVLRHPTSTDIRFGSLLGMKILLLSSADTADVCQQLKAELDKVDPDCVTILATTDAYPFKAATPEIEKWMSGVKRVVNRSRVVLEPNDDRWRKGYWVSIETMESISTLPRDKQPRVEAIADRAQNRITIKAVGVESMQLQLNDGLVDLDKDFTIVVNDKAITEKRSRDFNRMLDYVILRFDPDFLFPVQFRVRVPKPEPKAGDGKPGEAGVPK